MAISSDDQHATARLHAPQLLAGRVQAGDPEEDNAVFDLLYDYETVPLNRGAYSREVTFAGTLGAAVYRERVGTSSHNLGTMRGDKVAVCIPLVDTSSCWWGQALTGGRLPISHSGRSIHFTYHEGHEHLVLAVDRALCDAGPGQFADQSAIPITRSSPTHQQFLSCSPQRVLRWSKHLQTLLHAAKSLESPLKPQRLENELITAVRSLFAVGSVADVQSSAAKMLVEAALEQIDTAAEPLSVADICVALNVGRRTLELAFRHVVNTSPRQYLLQRQLARSYTLLKRGSPDSTRVTDVAVACGFYELGRFAGRYRKTFGETPRQTLLTRTTSHRPRVLAG